MNKNWQSFLEQLGANIIDGAVIDYGNPDAELKSTEHQTILADLSHYGIIEAQGEEASDFLQNQLSNDIKQVDDTNSQLSSYCSPKGRMLASLRIFKYQGNNLLLLPKDTLETTLKRLRMFIMRSKVTLEDKSDEFASFGLSGSDAEKLLTNAHISPPQEINGVVQLDNFCVIRIPGSHPRFEFFGTPEALTKLWDSFSNNALPVGRSAWSLQDIESGIPDIFEGTVEAFVPQMANLHAIGGVSFKKGCYPGQEVVARMQYLGKLKRRMYRAHTNTNNIPLPGDNLYSSKGEDSVGKVVQAQNSPQGGVNLLAVLQIAQVEQNSIHLESKQGPQLKFIDLPYEVPLEREK